ncbi:uncharacterized protein LOC130994344 [Salvia miltiorrhiza]|uniref:uncharacterized protein LOC130994344 n=1 Tax=Salvia miltiorrhiza TaxID=226208 RepID=UPI0025ACE8BB|nr:uncharacterized protein LOC130994344 [Salvia miltiorrhiza]
MKMFETQIGQMATAISKLQQSRNFSNNAKVNPKEQCMAIGLKNAATAEGSYESHETRDESKKNDEGGRRVPPPYRPPGWMPFPQRHYKIVDLPSGNTQEGPKMAEDESAPPVVEDKAEEVTIEVSGKKKDEKKKAASPATVTSIPSAPSERESEGAILQVLRDLQEGSHQHPVSGGVTGDAAEFEKALCDLGASTNLMPLSIFQQLAIGEVKPTSMMLQMADRSVTYPRGIVEDVLVKVGDFIFPADFVVLDIEDDKKIPLILGHSFLATGRALIDVEKGELTLRVHDESKKFSVYEPCRIHKDEVPKKAKDPGKDLGDQISKGRDMAGKSGAKRSWSQHCLYQPP